MNTRLSETNAYLVNSLSDVALYIANILHPHMLEENPDPLDADETKEVGRIVEHVLNVLQGNYEKGEEDSELINILSEERIKDYNNNKLLSAKSCRITDVKVEEIICKKLDRDGRMYSGSNNWKKMSLEIIKGLVLNSKETSSLINTLLMLTAVTGMEDIRVCGVCYKECDVNDMVKFEFTDNRGVTTIEDVCTSCVPGYEEENELYIKRVE